MKSRYPSASTNRYSSYLFSRVAYTTCSSNLTVYIYIGTDGLSISMLSSVVTIIVLCMCFLPVSHCGECPIYGT